jgi:hypothetical protein
MYVYFLTDSRVCGRYNDRFAVGDKSNVANECLVENLVNNRVIVLTTFWQSLQGSPVGWCKGGQL